METEAAAWPVQIHAQDTAVNSDCGLTKGCIRSKEEDCRHFNASYAASGLETARPDECSESHAHIISSVSGCQEPAVEYAELRTRRISIEQQKEWGLRFTTDQRKRDLIRDEVALRRGQWPLTAEGGFESAKKLQIDVVAHYDSI